MELVKEQSRRQEIKQKVNHILEPLIIDLLIAKPENPYSFMREWLEQRKEFLDKIEASSPAFSLVGRKGSKQMVKM